jgi:hypothetical protein
LSQENQIPADQLTVDGANLYREEIYTDLRIATIRKLTPVKTDGSADEERPILFSVETQLMTPQGMIPVQARVDAVDLAEVIEKFPGAINDAVERMVEEAREMRRQESTRIVTPGELGGGSILGPGGR